MFSPLAECSIPALKYLLRYAKLCGTSYKRFANTGKQNAPITHEILTQSKEERSIDQLFSCPLGGESYLRLMEFLPDRKTVRVKTCSPLYDKYLLDADQQFAVAMDR
jgi:hypothetical protein